MSSDSFNVNIALFYPGSCDILPVILEANNHETDPISSTSPVMLVNVFRLSTGNRAWLQHYFSDGSESFSIDPVSGYRWGYGHPNGDHRPYQCFQYDCGLVDQQ